MKIKQLHALADRFPENDSFQFDGHCHDCRIETACLVQMTEYGFNVSGGIPYVISPNLDFDPENDILLKCTKCHEKEPLIRYQKCEVYSRIVGYMRPVSNWNDAKKAEFKMRKNFDRCLCNS